MSLLSSLPFSDKFSVLLSLLSFAVCHRFVYCLLLLLFGLCDFDREIRDSGDLRAFERRRKERRKRRLKENQGQAQSGQSGGEQKRKDE